MTQSAVVVGAGVGGLSAAIGLGLAGWQVTVLERWPAVVGIGAGIGIWPDTQHVLDRLGVGQAFRDRSVEFGATSLFTAAGRRLCAVPSRGVERRGGAPIRILPRSALIDLLAAAAREVCEIRTGTDVVSEPELLTHADLIVGADGLRSAVRGSLFSETAAPTPTGYVAWRGSVDLELAPGDYGESWGERSLVGLTRLSPGRTNWYLAAPDPGTDFLETAARFRQWHAPIPQVIADTTPDRVLRHPIEELRPHLSSYVSGNAVLIGDAAHAMTPNLGRGACEAVIDVDALLDALQASAADVRAALATYDRARRRTTQRVVDRSRRMLSLATHKRTGLRNATLRMVSPVIR